jgi:hypothetical protein
MDRIWDLLPAQILTCPPSHVPGEIVRDETPANLREFMIRKQIAYMQDRSQLLLLCLESMYGSRSDLTAADIDEALKGPWNVCREGLHAVMHDGLLPDLSPILQHLPLWNHSVDNPFDHDPFVKAILRIFVKSVFQPSKVREINRSLCNELREPKLGDRSPRFDRRQIVHVLCKLMFCSLAGFYPHARYVVGYRTRRELYRWLSFDVPSIEEMRLWMLDHKLLLTFILREYHIFHMDSTPGLRRVFQELYEYPSIRTNVLHGMDRVRVRFDEGVQNVLRVLESMHPVSEIYKKSTFVIDCALLDNDGSCIYYFCQKYDRPQTADLLRFFFWRFTYIGKFEQFGAALPADPQTERYVREIILYWLLLKECCRHASWKQTKKDYLDCISRIPKGEIIPALPKKYASAAETTAKGKSVYWNCMKRAQEIQHHVISKFKCICSAAVHDQCLLKVIVSLVESFDVHRVIRPTTSTSAIGYHSVSDRLSLEKCLSQAYIACLAWCYRPRMTTFADEMVSSCRTVRILMQNSRDIKDPCFDLGADVESDTDSIGFQPSIIASAKNRKRIHDRVAIENFWKAKEIYESTERDDVQKFIHTVITNFPPSREISVEWMMIAFGISYKSVQAINKARDLMLSETNRRAPYNACFSIASVHPRDFWILDDFFQQRFQYESIRIYPIDRDTAQKQVTALHEKLDLVESGEILPASASTVYYCPDHRAILAAKVGTEYPKKGYVNTLNIGPEGVSVDPVTGFKYCTSQSQRGDRRSCNPVEDLDIEIEEDTTLMESKKKCTFKPLKKVNLLGRIFQLYKSMYLLCPQCGCPMKYTREKFTEIGLWCGCCIQGEEAMAKKLGIPWNAAESKPDYDAMPDSVHGIPVRQHICYWCNTPTRRNKPTTYYLLYDDIETYKLVYIPFCDKDCRKWFASDPGQMRLSNIVKNMRSKLMHDEHSFPYDYRNYAHAKMRPLATRIQDAIASAPEIEMTEVSDRMMVDN